MCIRDSPKTVPRSFKGSRFSLWGASSRTCGKRRVDYTHLLDPNECEGRNRNQFSSMMYTRAYKLATEKGLSDKHAREVASNAYRDGSALFKETVG
eukprot:6095763-Pyramimonas_sp.AAC.1